MSWRVSHFIHNGVNPILPGSTNYNPLINTSSSSERGHRQARKICLERVDLIKNLSFHVQEEKPIHHPLSLVDSCASISLSNKNDRRAVDLQHHRRRLLCFRPINLQWYRSILQQFLRPKSRTSVEYSFFWARRVVDVLTAGINADIFWGKLTSVLFYDKMK